MIKYCNTCALRQLNTGPEGQQYYCQLHKYTVDINKDFCSKHISELPTCDFCGNGLLVPQYIFNNDEWKILCPQCSEKLNTCVLCKNSTHCEFEQSNSPLPKYIMQTIQQGGMTMQTQIRNPEREKALCPTCKCWNGSSCERVNGTCGTYSL